MGEGAAAVWDLGNLCCVKARQQDLQQAASLTHEQNDFSWAVTREWLGFQISCKHTEGPHVDLENSWKLR